MHVLKSTQAKMCIKEARADEISMHADKISMRAEEDWFHLFTSSVATLCQMSEQLKTLSWIPLKQNKIVGALSEIRERVQEDKKMASKLEHKLEMPVLDRGGSKRAPNSLNNRDKPELTVLDRGDSKRAPNSLNN